MFDTVEIRPTIWFAVPLHFGSEHGGVGWDAATKQAVILFRHGYGKLPRREPERPNFIDRLAEEGSAFLELERAVKFRSMVRRLVEQVCENIKDIPYPEQERMRDMLRKTEGW